MSSSRPSRVKVAFIYLKRIIRWRRNSAPYLSCDAFADLADFVYKPPRWRNLKKHNSLFDARIIFCESHNLQELFDTYSENLTAKVVISGNSDFEFHDIPRNIPKSVRALFLQNSFVSDNKLIFTLPIGLENFRLGVNGNPRLVRTRKSRHEKVRKVVFGPLSATHPVRENVIRTFSKSSAGWDLYLERMSPRHYDQICRKYSFVAAVRGNGVDTHRLWEALYRGLTPIIVQDKWWSSLEHLFPQVIPISSWNISEIESVIRTQSECLIIPEDIAALWMPYWSALIASHLE